MGLSTSKSTPSLFHLGTRNSKHTPRLSSKSGPTAEYGPANEMETHAHLLRCARNGVSSGRLSADLLFVSSRMGLHHLDTRPFLQRPSLHPLLIVLENQQTKSRGIIACCRLALRKCSTTEHGEHGGPVESLARCPPWAASK